MFIEVVVVNVKLFQFQGSLVLTASISFGRIWFSMKRIFFSSSQSFIFDSHCLLRLSLAIYTRSSSNCISNSIAITVSCVVSRVLAERWEGSLGRVVGCWNVHGLSKLIFITALGRSSSRPARRKTLQYNALASLERRAKHQKEKESHALARKIYSHPLSVTCLWQGDE